jgi:hypothetical protein
VVLCEICFGELMSRGNVDFMSVCTRVRVGGSMMMRLSIVWLTCNNYLIKFRGIIT